MLVGEGWPLTKESNGERIKSMPPSTALYLAAAAYTYVHFVRRDNKPQIAFVYFGG